MLNWSEITYHALFDN